MNVLEIVESVRRINQMQKINMNKNIDLISKIDIRSMFCMNEVIIFLKKDKI